ncbi:MAG: hypothetical protein V1827_00410 [Candidatus Micrarchaeota archaeon]
MAEKMAKVIPLFPKGRKEAGRPRKKSDALTEPGRDGVKMDRNVCIALLKTVAPVDERLTSALAIPDSLYQVGEYSFSSEASKSLQRISGALSRDEASAPALATRLDFGLDISTEGNNVFCTLVDMNRKIVVRSSLGNVLAGLSWAPVTASINLALEEVKSLNGSGERFDMIYVERRAVAKITL